jgi:hypothetical protein
MIARSFKSVAWVAAIGAAALICYMFSLRVAEERAGLAQLEAQILKTERSIRTLKTELGTRGRVQQLQHWASADFGFTSPGANQFLENDVTLARLDNPADAPAMEAPVQMAAAPAPVPAAPRIVQASAPAAPPVRPAVRQARAEPATPANPLLHRASVVRPEAPAAQARPAPRAAGAPVAAVAAARAPAAAAPAKPKAATARPAASLVNQRTLSDISARSQAERSARQAR